MPQVEMVFVGFSQGETPLPNFVVTSRCPKRYQPAMERVSVLQVIKGYPKGKMSQHIHNLKEGDSLECKGPIMKLPYKPNMKKKLGMVGDQPCLHAQ